MPRIAKPARREEDEDRVFHLTVREAMLLFVRAYERRYLPELRKAEKASRAR